jgi:citrate synthase
MNRLSFLA